MQFGSETHNARNEANINTGEQTTGNLEVPTTTETTTTKGIIGRLSTLEEVRNLLPDGAVLLPLPKRSKAPVTPGWQNTTLQETQNSEYQAQLLQGNVGVLLGAPSGHLCTIDIDDDGAVESFLNLNPGLRNTLQTRGRRGIQIWFKVEGDYPKACKLETTDKVSFGEWRADGNQSVIAGIHPDTNLPYTIVVGDKPITMKFTDLVWPEDLRLPWIKTPYDLLVDKYGPPVVVGGGGGLQVGQMFFVGKFAMENVVVYDTVLQDFFLYERETGLWKKVSDGFVKQRFLTDLTNYAKESKQPSLLLKLRDGLTGELTNLLRTYKGDEQAFQKEHKVIHVKNGMIHLDVDPPELREFHPDYRSRNSCPFDFDPNAECPRFLNELLGAALNQEDISLLQRWAGACLLGLNEAQRILIVTGTPGGGKSTLMNIIESIIGTQNVAQLRTEHLSERFELYSYTGKTLLAGKDVPPDFLMRKGTHVLKSLVGHDLLEAEKKGSNERIPLVGDFNVAITCNTNLKIRIQGDVEAWQRRLLIVNYERPKVTNRIANFAEELIRTEGAGILKWMIEGSVYHLEELSKGDYQLTHAQKARIDKLLAESDSVRKFVEDRLTPERDGEITSQEVVAAYFSYCEEMGWEAFPSTEVQKVLPSLILEIHRVNRRNDISGGLKQVRGYKGLAVRPM